MRFERFTGAVASTLLGALWLVLSVGQAGAAESVYLKLEIDGTLIEGESPVTSLDRENTIVCSSFGENGYIPIDAASGEPTGRRQHRPITIVKPVDRSSPLLWKAWAMGETVTRADFMFFRPGPGGSGTEENFMTISLQGGAIVSMSVGSQDAVTGGANAPPALESVSFTFQQITWTYESTGATHTDTWSATP